MATLLAAAFCLLLTQAALAAPTVSRADGAGGTYPLLERSYGLELPDCGHKVPHITEAMDGQLGRPVFVFHAHVNQDDDRCGKTDRQRTELRGRATGLQGREGATVHYRWKFKLPEGFRTSGNFTHIFQLKAYGNGHGSGAPIMTLTPRNSSFGIDGRIGKRGTTDLGKFLGQWAEVDLRIVHANAGRVELTIRRVQGGGVLLSHSSNADMWDDGAAYGAPKFGIYRSLANRSALRDEQVRFADICVSRTSARECSTANADLLLDDPAGAAALDPQLDDGGAAAYQPPFDDDPTPANDGALSPAAPDPIDLTHGGCSFAHRRPGATALVVALTLALAALARRKRAR